MLCCTLTENLYAQQKLNQNQTKTLKNELKDINFSAGEINIDVKKQRVTISDNAIVESKTSRLKAEKILFDNLKKTITANGNVELLYRVNNLVIKADKVILTNKLDIIYIENLSLHTDDNRVFYIGKIKHIADDLYMMEEVRYLPCEKCNDGEKPPRWQVFSKVAKLDRKKHQVVFQDPSLKLFSIPFPVSDEYEVDYLKPWTRGSGFLISKLFTLTKQTTLETRYLYALDTDKNFILSQYSKIGGSIKDIFLKPTFKITYEQALDNGDINIAILGGVDKSRGVFLRRNSNSVFLFHSRGEFDMSNSWKWGYLYNFQSDYYASRDYNVMKNPELRHKIHLTGLKDRNYFQIQSIGFFDFDEISRPTQITVLPEVRSEYHFSGIAPNGDLNLKFSMLKLNRDDEEDQEQDMTRVSANLAYTYKAITAQGHFFEAGISGTSNNYLVETGQYLINNNKKQRYITRFIPATYLRYRYPLASPSSEGMVIFSPRMLIQASNAFGRNPPIVRDESVYPILQTTNIFEPERFTGNDLYEGGMQINYGFDWSVQSPNQQTVKLRVARRFDFSKNQHDKPIGAQNGRFSDYIIGLDMYINDEFSIRNSIRLDKHNQNLKEYYFNANSTIGNIDYSISASYLKEEEKYGQLGFSTKIPISKYTFFSFETNYDYQNKFIKETIATFSLDEESIFFSISYKRERNSLIKNEINQSLFFDLILKKL